MLAGSITASTETTSLTLVLALNLNPVLAAALTLAAAVSPFSRVEPTSLLVRSCAASDRASENHSARLEIAKNKESLIDSATREDMMFLSRPAIARAMAKDLCAFGR